MRRNFSEQKRRVFSSTVILQPYTEEPTPETKCSDKFLLLQCPIPPHIDSENFAEFWAQQEREHSEHLTNKKLRVHYNIASPEELPALLAAAAAASAAAGGAAAHHHHHHEQQASDEKHVSDPTNIRGDALVADPVPSTPSANPPPSYDTATSPAAVATPSTGLSNGAPSLGDAQLHTPQQDPALQEAVDAAESKIRSVSNEIDKEKVAAFGGAPASSAAASTPGSLPASDAAKSLPRTAPSLSSSSSGSSKAPGSSSSPALRTSVQSQRKIIDGNTDIPLPQVVIMVIVSFLIGWFFF